MNDDGIYSNGIFDLANKFKEIGNVTVVAPDKQMSAMSHALTTSTPLRAKQVEINNRFFGFALSGTPVDCVKWAIISHLKKKPDIMLSGINHGRNTGVNIMYSGTVAAAAEGHLLGIPSFAVSLSSHNPEKETVTAAEYAYKIIQEIFLQNKRNLPTDLFLNINVPAIASNEIKGIRFVKASSSFWDDEYEKRIDPFGRTYYWFNGSYVYDETDPETDDTAVDAGYVAVTPLQYSFTNLSQLKEIKSFENLFNPTSYNNSIFLDTKDIETEQTV